MKNNNQYEKKKVKLTTYDWCLSFVNVVSIFCNLRNLVILCIPLGITNVTGHKMNKRTFSLFFSLSFYCYFVCWWCDLQQWWAGEWFVSGFSSNCSFIFWCDGLLFIRERSRCITAVYMSSFWILPYNLCVEVDRDAI